MAYLDHGPIDISIFSILFSELISTKNNNWNLEKILMAYKQEKLFSRMIISTL